MSCIYITTEARTPFGKFRGALVEHDAISLGRLVIDTLIARDQPNGGTAAVEYLAGGAGLLGGAHLTALRQSVITSQLANSTPSQGVDRACCSGMSALTNAAAWVTAGGGKKAMAIGVESLSNMPVLVQRASERRVGGLAMSDPLRLAGTVSDKTIAQYSAEEALKYGVSRADQDAWALQSHQRYFQAKAAGLLAADLITIATKAGALREDEGPRTDTSAEKLARLPAVNDSATITAGNAPQLSDGAAGLIISTTPTAERIEVLDWVQTAGELQSGTSIPAHAILKLLARNFIALDQIDVIEINEAFAATPLVSTQVLAEASNLALEPLRTRTNSFGGAVAIGHPLGASGIRIVMTAIERLRARGGGLAVCAICGGFGQGEAVLIRMG